MVRYLCSTGEKGLGSPAHENLKAGTLAFVALSNFFSCTIELSVGDQRGYRRTEACGHPNHWNSNEHLLETVALGGHRIFSVMAPQQSPHKKAL